MIRATYRVYCAIRCGFKESERLVLIDQVEKYIQNLLVANCSMAEW